MRFLCSVDVDVWKERDDKIGYKCDKSFPLKLVDSYQVKDTIIIWTLKFNTSLSLHLSLPFPILLSSFDVRIKRTNSTFSTWLSLTLLFSAYANETFNWLFARSDTQRDTKYAFSFAKLRFAGKLARQTKKRQNHLNANWLSS